MASERVRYEIAWCPEHGYEDRLAILVRPFDGYQGMHHYMENGSIWCGTREEAKKKAETLSEARHGG